MKGYRTIIEQNLLTRGIALRVDMRINTWRFGLLAKKIGGKTRRKETTTQSRETRVSSNFLPAVSPLAGVKFASKVVPGQFKQRPVHNGIENSRTRLLAPGTSFAMMFQQGASVIPERTILLLVAQRFCFFSRSSFRHN